MLMPQDMSLFWSGGRLVGFGLGRLWSWPPQSLGYGDGEYDLCAEGTKLSVHVVGAEQRAEVIAHSVYDPAGAAMRA